MKNIANTPNYILISQFKNYELHNKQRDLFTELINFKDINLKILDYTCKC